MTRTPRIVRIIASICSIAIGDFVFTGEKNIETSLGANLSTE